MRHQIMFSCRPWYFCQLGAGGQQREEGRQSQKGRCSCPGIFRRGRQRQERVGPAVAPQSIQRIVTRLTCPREAHLPHQQQHASSCTYFFCQHVGSSRKAPSSAEQSFKPFFQRLLRRVLDEEEVREFRRKTGDALASLAADVKAKVAHKRDLKKGPMSSARYKEYLETKARLRFQDGSHTTKKTDIQFFFASNCGSSNCCSCF